MPDLFGPRKNLAEFDEDDALSGGDSYSGGSATLVARYADAADRDRFPRDEDKRRMARRPEN